MSMEFYRSSAAGIALTKALNTMLESEELTMDEAVKILEEFDACFVRTMRESYCTQKRLDTAAATVRSFKYGV
jgi:hypothetical protein